jgi:hypothetical protein
MNSLLQPLIPTDVATKAGTKHVRFDRFMITCFYAPVHLFSSVCAAHFVKTFSKRLCGKQELFVGLFLCVAQEVLRLYSEFGMVLPIPNAMHDSMPQLYELLVPKPCDKSNEKDQKVDDKDLLSSIKWLVRSDVRKVEPQREGWSNIPIIICILSYLVQSKCCEMIEPINEQQVTKNKDMESLESMAPKFKVAGIDGEFSFLELTKLIIFEASKPNSEKHQLFHQAVNKKLKGVKDKTVRVWLQDSFLEKHDFFLLPEDEKEAAEDESSEANAEEDDKESEKNDLENDAGQTSSSNNIATDTNGSNDDDVDDEDNDDEDDDEDDDDDLDGDDDDDDDDDDFVGQKKKGETQAAKLNKQTKSTPSKADNAGQPQKLRKRTKGSSSTDEEYPKAKMIKSAETRPVVSTFHPLLPPVHIDLSARPWYWQYCQASQTCSWPFALSRYDLKFRMKENIAKVTFAWIAVNYAKHTGHVSGADLLFILSCPGNGEAEEKANWEELMNDFQERCDNTWDKCVAPPTFTPPADCKSFLSYFELLIQKDFPHAHLPGQQDESLIDDASNQGGSAIRQRSPPYWSRKDVVDVRNLSMSTVESKIHSWKCQILFDSYCYCFFDESRRTDLTETAFNAWDNGRFPSDQQLQKRKWELDFNLLVYYTDMLDLANNAAAKEGTLQQKRGSKFLKHIVTQTDQLRDEIKKKDKQLLEGALSQVAASSAAASTCQDVEDALSPVAASKAATRQVFTEVKVSNQQKHDELLGCFFRNGGFLRWDLKGSIDFGKVRHGFILFRNFETQDVRWFIPLLTVHKSFFNGKYKSLRLAWLLWLTFFTFFNASVQMLNYVTVYSIA